MSRKPQTPTTAISSLLPTELTLLSSQRIATLWAGYGSITRLSINSSAGPQSLVLKTVRPPSTSSNADESHLRKTVSYNVERWFYNHLSPRLSGRCAVATNIPISDTQSLLLSDLSVSFQHEPYGGLDTTQTHAVLRFLAAFHATFWNPADIPTVPPPLIAAKEEGVWEQGGYWYLDTRREEYESMASDEGWAWLERHGRRVGERIRETQVGWKTVVHGDAKAANIFFSSPPAKKGKKKTENGDGAQVEAAMYDFQYVGVGLPTTDLVYFLTTSVSSRVLEEQEEELLRYYLEELGRCYMETHEGKRLEETEGYTWEVFWEQWELAVVDWLRFMAGWGMWGSCDWVEERGRGIVERWEEEKGKT